MKKILVLLFLSFNFLPGKAQIQTLQKLGQLSFATTCAGVWHYADSTGNEYALLGNGDGLVIVNVTDPVNPVVLFTVPAASSAWREVKTYSHFAYAGTEGGGGITIVDLSGLPGSYLSKTYEGDGAIAGQLLTSHTVQVFGDYLYIFGSNIGAVMCSLADPWNPQYVGTYNANYVHDGYVLNDTLYASETLLGFSVVDVTNKANPVVLETQPTPGLMNHNGWFSDNKKYFFTTDEVTTAPVGVFDVSDITDIKLVGTYKNDTMSDQEVHNTRVFNDYLICPSYGSQLTIADAARPENPIEIARYHTGSYLCWDASPYLPSGNIIATDKDGEFYVFAPNYFRACYLEGNITDQVSGNPIHGATVKILTTTKVVSSTLPGDYKTGWPTAGTYDVEFVKPGYVTKVITGVIITNGNLTILDVQLEPFVFNINVVDNVTGLAVPFAKLKIQNPNTDLELITDTTGSLVLYTVSTGSYIITAAKWGYISKCNSTLIGAQGTVTIQLDPGLYDDFTFDFGWSTSSTASTGAWVREEPVGTIFSTTQANPENDDFTDCTDKCFITGNGGGTANVDDVDDGEVILTSPVCDLSAYANPYLSYSRWFYEQFTANSAANDTMFIRISNGFTTEIVETVTGPSPTNSTWVPDSLRILDFISVTNNINIIVSLSDKTGTGNPLEGGFDKFRISEGPLFIGDVSGSKNTISVYPSPFEERLEIDLTEVLTGEKVELVVTDISGKEIFNMPVKANGKTILETGTWNKGVYVVNLRNSIKPTSPQKIVKL